VKTSTPHHAWPAVVWPLVFALLLATPAEARRKKPRTADDLQIVDCLLPGQIRKLGRSTSYLTARKPIRTSAIACAIQGGEYVAYDRSTYAASLEHWQPEANLGNAQAQAYVGQIYEVGVDGNPDYEMAALWYRRAAEQGLAQAQINLAHLYETGQGVPQDLNQAVAWWARASGLSEEVVRDDRERAAALEKELAEFEVQRAVTERLLDTARAELEQSREELLKLRQQLKEAESSASGATQEFRRLREQLQLQEEIVGRRQETMQAGEREREKILTALGAARQQVRHSNPAPTLEIVRPDVLATRGPALVQVPIGQGILEVRGKVTAPAGLRQLTVDEQPLEADHQGLFSTRLRFSGRRQEVHFVATDREGRDARATLVLQPATAPTPPQREATPRPGASGDLPKNSTSPYHALILGVADYQHLSPLSTALQDAEDIAAILAKKYGFQVQLLKNPNRYRLLSALETVRQSLRPEDHLLIYYAGHGRLEGERSQGYWVPVEAADNTPDKWISNRTISDYLQLTAARHILVISDSCYSGTLARSNLSSLARELRTRSADQPAETKSRHALTSGGLQPVLDEGGGRNSIFANALLKVLRLSSEELEISRLFPEIRGRVAAAASELGFDQVPEYAPIHFAGHEGGELRLQPLK